MKLEAVSYSPDPLQQSDQQVHIQGSVRWLPVHTPTGFSVLASVSKPSGDVEGAATPDRGSRGGSATPMREDSPVVATTSGVVDTYKRCNPEGPFSGYPQEGSQPRGRALTDPAEPTGNEGQPVTLP